MNTYKTKLFRNLPAWIFAAFLLLTSSVFAQTCFTADDMDAPTKTALLNAGQKYFQMVASGDAASLKQNTIASLASNFSGIEGVINDNKDSLVGAQASPRSPFLLKAEGTAPLAHAEFLCGVFGASGQTANSAVFEIPNLSPGSYGFMALDAKSTKTSHVVSFVLQLDGTIWKLAGLVVKPTEIKGHDGNWFLTQARAYKTKNQLHDAWFYFLEAHSLLSPVDFMSTQATDKLYDEAQTAKPSDLPPMDLAVNGKTYKLTAMYPLVVGEDLDLIVKYQSADVSNSSQSFQDNMAVIKGLVAKYPEFRDAFVGIVARATEPSGRDYGSLLQMKDIK